MHSKIIWTIFLVHTLTNVNCADTNTKQNEEIRSYNILGIFHFPSQSHHILGSTLLKELARRGHNVTMISPFPFDEKIPNYTDVKLEGLLEFKEEHMREYMKNDKFGRTFGSMLKNVFQMVPKIGNIILGQDSMQNLLNSESKFDVIIMFYPLSEPFFPLSHRFNAPIILFSPTGATDFLNKITGNISPYSYVPHILSPYTDNMSFFQRVLNSLIGISMDLLTNIILIPQYKTLSKQYFPDAPPLEELYNNVALAFVNGHFSTASPRPYTPNIIPIGGFHVESADPLPKDLQEYLNDAKDGVIYFGFGTNINMSDLPKDKLEMIVKCFSKLKQKVLWKFDGHLEDAPKNIKFAKWLPQKSILVHPNVKAFITHGGKGSIVESIKAGVPMLAMPFFGDQPQNVAEAVHEKYAIRLQFSEITEETFSNALQEVLTNPIYRENVKIKSSLLNAQPVKPMDTAMYWIDHVVQHRGADHLKPASLKLNVFQELCLDVYAFLIGAFILIILAIYLLVRGICKLCRRCRSRRIKEDKLKTS